MDSYLVTGGAGFIGSNIVHELVERGERVRVLDDFSTGSRQNLSDIFDEIELIEADIRDPESVQDAMKGMDYVLHHAAVSSVPRSVDEPILLNDVNVNGTLKLLIAARDAGVKRFIYAASSSVYGDVPALPKREDMMPNPLSPYAVSKLTGEHYCRVFYNIYSLETVSLRYFNVFGPRQEHSSEYSAAIPKFINAMLKDQPITIYGSGEQSRDFIYVQDVAQANLLACKAPDAAGEVINIACGNGISLNQLISTIEDELHAQVRCVYTRPRTGDVKHSRADISKARALLGYEPRVTFGEGLRKTVEWFTDGRRASVFGSKM